ncbi:DUF397 domain-containing protein [Streptomyces sp. SBT349]|uniref:DUF397 domain-containing protein n=1 Tax=Streptomyces sp. SBT349 TaxID=1580539 RepID=UPI00066D9E29|nr:DUF397 domain-containing protein [Streptomyces sp. SBT349]
MTIHTRTSHLHGVANWFTSSYSGNGVNCVEVADLTGTAYGGVAVRDSKERSGPALLVSPGSFAAFVADVREGRYDA